MTAGPASTGRSPSPNWRSPTPRSSTQPRRARAWFEAAIDRHLDLGRPEQVSLVVDRKVINRGQHKTPGRFATEVITHDVDPQLQIHYKSSKAKALPQGRPGPPGGNDHQ